METSKKISACGWGKVTIGGAGETRTPDFLRASKSLDEYLNLLAVKNLAESYIEGNRRFLADFVNTHPIITPDTAIEYLSRYSHITQNSRARYASYWAVGLGSRFQQVPR